jgi:DNA-binding XRE family transcriptional regulator
MSTMLHNGYQPYRYAPPRKLVTLELRDRVFLTRRRLKMTRAEFASEVEISPRTIQRLENEGREPKEAIKRLLELWLTRHEGLIQ